MVWRSLLSLLICSHVLATGFNPRFTHLDQRQGLSQNSVTAILQDSDGLMWFGTQDGLNLYDGYEFTVFRHNKEDSFSLRDNFILCLAEDRQGNIWVGTRNGLCVYDKDSRRFTSLIRETEKRIPYHAQVRKLVAGKNGEVLFSDVRRNLVSACYSNSAIRDVRVIKENVSAFDIIRDTLHFVQGSNAYWCTFPYSSFSIPAANESLRGLKPESVFTAGICVFLYDSNAVLQSRSTEIKMQDIAPNCALVISENEFWIGTPDGLYVYRNGETFRLKKEKGSNFSLADNHINCLYRTKDGLIWVGTAGGGVSIYDPLQNFFTIHGSDKDNAERSGSAWSVIQIPQGHIIGTSLGVFLDGNLRMPSWWSAVPDTAFVTCMTFDHKSNLWLGTRSGGIYIIDTLKSVATHIRKNNSGLKSDQIRCLTPYENGMWIGTLYGLHYYDQDEKWTWYYRSSHPDSLGSGYIQHVIIDQNGNPWISASAGPYKFDLTGKRFINYFRQEPEDVSYPIINSITELSSGELVFCTMGGGIDIFNPQTRSSEHYSSQNGLKNDVAYGCLEDGYGRLWVSTNKGIQCIDRRAGTIDSRGIKEGLPSDEFVVSAFYKDGSGRFWFGSADGMISFHPDEYVPFPATAKPVVHELKIDDEWRAIRDTLLLARWERDIEFRFTALDYRRQENIRFEYRLIGYDSSWKENAPGDRSVNFTNLPYGEYRFELRVRYGNLQYSPDVYTCTITIPAPFWMSVWFRLLMVLTVILCTAYVVRHFSQRKVRQMQKRLETERKLNEERKRISDDLHDNVGAQLTYIITALDNAEFKLSRDETKKELSKKIGELSEYTRGTMQQLRGSIWALRSENIDSSSLATKISEYVRLLGETLTSTEFSFSNTGMNRTLPPEVAIELLRITQESLNNAVKHSEADLIRISFHTDPSGVEIRVNDNGKGFDLKQNKEGHYGIENMKNRAEKIGAGLKLESVAGEGTEITVMWKEYDK